MKTPWTSIIAGVAGLVVLAMALFNVEVYRDWAFIDVTTGSREGYRELPFGYRVGRWHRETALETFIRAKHPELLRQHWVSYEGTGRNLFGGWTSRGHGRPGTIIVLPPDVLDRCCARASEEEKMRLHDVFSSGDQDKIEALVTDIITRAE